ncbi:MAG: thiamine-monophosphate kinase, partial [Lentisphaerae bacterium]|nr:thiamine-monophosphate kinase [Lentisphaerota bacterium]
MNEISLLKKITYFTGANRPDVLQGPGDDCAVVSIDGSDYDWLLKSDPVIENVHFNSDTDPILVGRKAANRAFSDIASMGGEPLWLLSGLVAHKTKMKLAVKVAEGISIAAAEAGVAVTGGDLSNGTGLEAHMTVIGRVKKGEAVLRSGANPGDGIYVTGELGG